MPQQPAPCDEIIPAAPASVIHELKYIDLLLLKTLAETESLTKTSARIGISVAKASRMLSSLRKLFNNELVQRCGPRMIATPELDRSFASGHQSFNQKSWKTVRASARLSSCRH